MATKIEILTSYLAEIQKMLGELKYTEGVSEYFYAPVMEDLVARYNQLLKKYYESTGVPLELFKLKTFDYSETKKTVRNTTVEKFRINLNSTKELIDDMIRELRSNIVSNKTPSHQMRKCLKLGVDGCPKNPQLEKRKVFIGMPFDNKYLDSYEYGIKLALQSQGLSAYRADENISNLDIMCKICEEIQKCGYLIFNISGLNPNVMLELGLSYGLGKETLIIKDKETRNISDIANIEYIEYSHAGELSSRLVQFFGK